jgi:hypothetical protein
MAAQKKYDVFRDAGGAQYLLRKTQQNNTEQIALNLSPQDFGLDAWSTSPDDLSTATQALVSGTQYFVRMPLPYNANLQNGNRITKVGLHLGNAALATPGTYSGLAVYSWTIGAANLVKLADTGADNGAAWVTSGASKYFEGSLSAAQSPVAGYLYASFIAAFTTMPNCYATAVNVNSFNIKGVTIAKSYSLAAQTSFGATVAIGGLTAGTFVPLMGFASS